MSKNSAESVRVASSSNEGKAGELVTKLHQEVTEISAEAEKTVSEPGAKTKSHEEKSEKVEGFLPYLSQEEKEESEFRLNLLYRSKDPGEQSQIVTRAKANQLVKDFSKFMSELRTNVKLNIASIPSYRSEEDHEVYSKDIVNKLHELQAMLKVMNDQVPEEDLIVCREQFHEVLESVEQFNVKAQQRFHKLAESKENASIYSGMSKASRRSRRSGSSGASRLSQRSNRSSSNGESKLDLKKKLARLKASGGIADEKDKLENKRALLMIEEKALERHKQLVETEAMLKVCEEEEKILASNSFQFDSVITPEVNRKPTLDEAKAEVMVSKPLFMAESKIQIKSEIPNPPAHLYASDDVVLPCTSKVEATNELKSPSVEPDPSDDTIPTQNVLAEENCNRAYPGFSVLADVIDSGIKQARSKNNVGVGGTNLPAQANERNQLRRPPQLEKDPTAYNTPQLIRSRQSPNVLSSLFRDSVVHDYNHLPYGDSQVMHGDQNPTRSVNFQLPNQRPVGINENELSQNSSIPTKICFENRPAFGISLYVFSNDPEDFPEWEESFSLLVDKSYRSFRERCLLLKKFIKGEALEIVRGCLGEPGEHSYWDARQELKRRFGDDELVSGNIIERLKNWPKISNYDANGISSYSRYLQYVANKVKQVPGLRHLDEPMGNREVVSKLPAYLISRWIQDVTWYEKVIKDRKLQLPTFPEFTYFARWLKEVSEEMSNSRFRGVYDMAKRPGADKFKNERIKTTKENIKSATSLKTDIERLCCAFCEESHHIIDCKKIAALDSHEEKLKIFYDKHPCYGCGEKGTSYHKAKTCRRKAKCNACENRHPTCLHRVIKEPLIRPPEPAQSLRVEVCGKLNDKKGNECCPVVRVHVKAKNCPEKLVECYCILDTQSTARFIAEEIADSLELNGIDTRLTLDTMSKTGEVSNAKKYVDLEVLSYDKSDQVLISCAYSRREIPARKSQIARAEICERWNHMQSVANKLAPFDPKLPVGLLVGTDVPKALRPTEIISGDESAPYAQHTALGWSIVGSLCDETFRTFLAETEAIVNSRPLTTDNLSGAKAPEPLTPSLILTLKPKSLLPPPGKFSKVDQYASRRWRRVQFLANEFWFRCQWKTFVQAHIS